MLCAIRTYNQSKVFACDSVKADGPFYCNGCQQELLLRKGRIKVHHFAHKPPIQCKNGQGESEAHHKCKQAIYNNLLTMPNVANLDVEVDFGEVVADVFCLINNIPVAIEVQRSNLSVNNITSRTVAYEKLGINVLWLALFDKKLNNAKYSPKAWEKWCHSAYFGRVYYWIEGISVIPVHFASHKTHVEQTEWYDEYGDLQSGGGYYKSSKRFKTPIPAPIMNLATDFKPIWRNSWKGGSILIPRCRLYGDRNNKWW